MTYDQKNGRFTIFGGNTSLNSVSGLVNDTWVLPIR
jgi:hypothetical protein